MCVCVCVCVCVYNSGCLHLWAMPWLRWLVAGLSPRSPSFYPRSVYVRFAVHKVAVGPVFLQVIRFPPASAILPTLHTHFHLHDVHIQSECRIAAICLLHTCRRKQARFTRIIYIFLIMVGAKVSVRVRCLVLVKIHGNSLGKLFIQIIRNSEVRINEFPLFSLHFLKCSARPCGAPTPQACKKIERQFSAPRVKVAVCKLCGYKDSFGSHKTMSLS